MKSKTWPASDSDCSQGMKDAVELQNHSFSGWGETLKAIYPNHLAGVEPFYASVSSKSSRGRNPSEVSLIHAWPALIISEIFLILI